jgi:hypothetical protein
MPLNRRTTTTTAYRTVYAGITQSIFLLKRGNDQFQGQVVQYKLFNCRISRQNKTGETVQRDMTVSHRAIWHIPKKELLRFGIHYLNALDRIVQIQGDEAGFTWQPEGTTDIEVKLFGNEVDLHCLRVDPFSLGDPSNGPGANL